VLAVGEIVKVVEVPVRPVCREPELVGLEQLDDELV
jgi:hypothetical protein